MTYRSEILHKWFSFQIFGYPFSLENNALQQIGLNSTKHITLTLMLTYTSAGKKELEKIRVQWHSLSAFKYSQRTLGKEHFWTYSSTTALQILLPSSLCILLRKLHTGEDNGHFVTNSWMTKCFQECANTLVKSSLPAAFRIMAQRTTWLKNLTVVQSNQN